MPQTLQAENLTLDNWSGVLLFTGFKVSIGATGDVTLGGTGSKQTGSVLVNQSAAVVRDDSGNIVKDG